MMHIGYANFITLGILIYTWPILMHGDVAAEWIVHGTLNAHVMGSSLSADSWLTM